MADIDWGQVDAQLKQKAGQWYDSSMLGDVQRNSSYGAGDNPDMSSVNDWVGRIANKAQLRGSNEVNSTYKADGQGGVTIGPTGKVNNPNGDGPSTLGSGGPANTPVTNAWNSSPMPAQDPQLKAQQDQLYQMLMDRATQGTTVDRNNPNIRTQADAYNANAERAKRNFISDQAEQNGPYANNAGVARMASERVGQQEGSFEADLIGNEISAKRDEIQAALSQAGGMLTAEQQMSLQKQLAQMNAALEARGQDITSKSNANQYDLGLRNIGLSDWGQQMYWDAVNSGKM
jgi:hypothetical protein